MNNSELILQCFKLLDDSTLSEERKTYWLNKISAADFTDNDVEALDAELDTEIEKVETAIGITEAEISRLEEKKLAAEEKALPVLREAAEKAPKYMEDATARWKQDVLHAEGEMMTQLEGVRGARQNEEIEAIRKKLGSK